MIKKLTGFAAAFLLTALLAAGVTGCSSNNTVLPAASEIADRLQSGLTFDDQLAPVDNDTALSLYSLSAEDIKEAKVYVGSGATAEEVAVFEAKDSASVKKVEEGVKARIALQKEGFADYVPEEMEKLEKPVNVTEGNTVILCLSNDNEAAKALIGQIKEGK